MNWSDRRLLGILLLLPICVLAAVYFSGQTFYWLDLTYLNHPWRSLTAELIQRGELPLWNPYAYLGMPLAAEMQCGAWYPGSLPFYLFSFVEALPIYYALQFCFAGGFAYLWLRSERFTQSASLGGAAVFMANGIMTSHIPFLQEFAVLSFIPAFLLFFGNSWPLILSLSLAFLAGYPTILLGGAAAAFIIGSICHTRLPVKEWCAAALLSLGLSSLLLLPAVQLLWNSQRGTGLDPAQTLRFGFSISDLSQLIGPILTGRSQFSPAVFWWKTVYVGLAATFLLFFGLLKIRRGRSIAFAAFLGLLVVLMLGNSLNASKYLWEHLFLLRYVRYPGNLAYLLMPPISILVACGLHRFKAAWALTFLTISELAVYGLYSQPTVPNGFFADKGPLVEQLQRGLDGHRYFISPGALEAIQGSGKNTLEATFDWKHRLYGLTNMPFHLSAISNFGEPLVPVNSYGLMDFLFTQPPDAAARLLPWSDAAVALTKESISSEALIYLGTNLWQEYKPREAAERALWLSNEDGDRITSGIDDLNIAGQLFAKPVHYARIREDRIIAEGDTQSGWLYLADPKFDGWKFWINGRPIDSVAAFGAFQKFSVPNGKWRLVGIYRPLPWTLGLVISLMTFAAGATFWYRRVLAFQRHTCPKKNRKSPV